MVSFDRVVLGNTLGSWLLAAGTAAMVVIVLRALRMVIARRFGRFAGRTATHLDDLAVGLATRTSGLVVLVVALAIGGFVVDLPAAADSALRIVLAAAVLLQVGLWGNELLTFGVATYVRRRVEQDPATITTITVLSFMGRLLLWSLILLVGLDNIGINVTTLVAGLGIGGIAVALALQNVLGDLFAAFAIALDRPFSIGDFLVVDDLSGTVEHIGLKTTRIRSLSGEQVAISNGNLLNHHIRNYKRMVERRVVLTVGVTYETPAETVAAIPGMLRAIVEEQEDVRLDRAHFKALGDFALIFEVVYFVLSPDYNLYMESQQGVNLALFRRFSEAGIDFAYPTQLLHVRWAGGSVPGPETEEARTAGVVARQARAAR